MGFFGVVAFFTLGALLIQSIADVLALITDEFDHYDGDAPEENATVTDPDQSPADPVDCSLTREQLLKVVYADGRVDASERSMLTDCGVSADTANMLTLLADWASFMISAAELGWMAGMTLWWCLFYMEFGLLGCQMGLALGYGTSLFGGGIVTVFLSIISPLASCIEGGINDLLGCLRGVVATALTSRIPDPFFNVGWNVFSYCHDRGYLDMGRCIDELGKD
jgi:hypothetical protein